MSLQEELRHLTVRLKEHSEARRIDALRNRLHDRNEELRTVVDGLRAQRRTVEALASEGIQVKPAVRRIEDTCRRYQAILKQRLVDEPETFDSGREYGQLVGSLGNVAAKTSEAAEKGWGQWAATLPQLKEHQKTLALLSDLGDEERANSLRARLVALADDARAVPNDADEFKRIRKQAEQLRKDLVDAESTAGNLPEPVVTLIKAAQDSKGASLKLVTADVLAWLNEHPDWLQRLRVVPR